LAEPALPTEGQLALLSPSQQRSIIQDLASQVRSLRESAKRQYDRVNTVTGAADIEVADIGLGVLGAGIAGAAYGTMQAKIDAGTLDEKWLHVGGGIDTTLIGSLGLGLAGVGIAKYVHDQHQARRENGEVDDDEDEETPMAQQIAQAIAKIGVGGVMLWAGRTAQGFAASWGEDNDEQEEDAA